MKWMWATLFAALVTMPSGDARACTGPDRSHVLYPNNGDAVPRDVVVIFDRSTPLPSGFDVVWMADDDGRQVHTIVDQRGERTFLIPEEELAPGRHRLRIVLDNGEVHESPYATAAGPLDFVDVEDRLAPTLEPPEVRVVGQGNNGLAPDGPCGGGGRAWVRFEVVDDVGVGLSVANTQRRSGALDTADPDALPHWTYLSWDPWSAPGKAFVVGTYDEAGRFSGWSEPVQVWLPPPNFCRCVTTTSTSATGAAVALLLLVLNVRRRRTT